MLGECRAGLRRYPNTDVGERYATVIAHVGDPDHADPEVWERTLGDFLDPTRPGNMMDVTNRVSQLLGSDAAEWRVDRLLRMAGAGQRR